MHSLVLAVGLMSFAPASGARTEDPDGRDTRAAAGLEVEPPESRDRAAARTFFDAGRAAYVGARFPEAIEAFSEAYRLSGSPGLLFSLAQAHRAQYETVDRSPDALRLALARYRDYLRLAPDGSNRAVAAESIAVLQTFAEAELEGFGEEDPVTRLVVSVPAEGAQIQLDDGEARRAPLNLEVSPGTHVLRLSAPGYHPETREVLVPEGASVPIEIALAEKNARLWVRGTQRGELWIDGESIGRTPMSEPLELPSGVHDVRVVAKGRRAFDQRIKLTRDTDREVAPALPLTGQSRAGWALVGLGSVGVLTGGILTGAALSAQAKAVELHRVRTEESIEAADWHAQHPELVRRRDGMRTGAAVAFGVSGAMAVGAVFLLALDRPEVGSMEDDPGVDDGDPDLQRPSFEVSAAPIQRGGMVSARGRF